MKVNEAKNTLAESQDRKTEPGHSSASLRPWRWLPAEGQFIVDSRGNVVAEIPCQGCNPADGAFIVTTVNSHDALREAAKSALLLIAKLYDEDAIPRLMRYEVDGVREQLWRAVNPNK